MSYSIKKRKGSGPESYIRHDHDKGSTSYKKTTFFMYDYDPIPDPFKDS